MYTSQFWSLRSHGTIKGVVNLTNSKTSPVDAAECLMFGHTFPVVLVPS